MNLLKTSFWKRWLLHSVLIWFIGNLFNFGNFLYKRSTYGNYLTYEDGTAVTAWDRFTDIFFNPEPVYIILLSVFLIELNYAILFKRKTWVFIAGCMTTGLAVTYILHYNYILRHGIIALSLDALVIVAPYAFAYPLILEFVRKRIFKAERLYEQ